MAEDLEKKDAKRKGRNSGIVIGAFASLAAALLYTKVSGGKHVTDGVSSVAKKGTDFVKEKIAEHKSNKSQIADESKKSASKDKESK